MRRFGSPCRARRDHNRAATSVGVGFESRNWVDTFLTDSDPLSKVCYGGKPTFAGTQPA
jgi:hypothetical protein